MSTKPTSVPEWASGAAAIVEPTAGKKGVGWVAEERPPAQYFNWILNLVYLWLAYLDDGDFTGGVTIDDLSFPDGATVDLDFAESGGSGKVIMPSYAMREYPVMEWDSTMDCHGGGPDWTRDANTGHLLNNTSTSGTQRAFIFLPDIMPGARIGTLYVGIVDNADADTITIEYVSKALAGGNWTVRESITTTNSEFLASMVINPAYSPGEGDVHAVRIAYTATGSSVVGIDGAYYNWSKPDPNI